MRTKRMLFLVFTLLLLFFTSCSNSSTIKNSTTNGNGGNSNETNENSTKSGSKIEYLSIIPYDTAVKENDTFRVGVYTQPTVYPATSKVEWTVGDSSIISMVKNYDSETEFKGLKSGSTKIYAKSKDGSNLISNELIIDVYKNENEIVLNPSELGIQSGSSVSGKKEIAIGCNNKYEFIYNNISCDGNSFAFTNSDFTSSNDRNNGSWFIIKGCSRNNVLTVSNFRITFESSSSTEKSFFFGTFKLGSTNTVKDTQLGDLIDGYKRNFGNGNKFSDAFFQNNPRPLIDAFLFSAYSTGVNFKISKIEFNVVPINK